MAALFKLTKDINGDAIVEAVILFPIMIMIFTALVLLAFYLPTRAALQRATQFTATALATQRSDDWLSFDDKTASYKWEDSKSNLKQVYVKLFSGGDDIDARSKVIVPIIEERSVSSKAGVLDVSGHLVNKIIYKEVVVTAKRVFTVPINLSFIKFPETITVTVTSTAVVQNGDEFVRNMDIAVDFFEFITKKFKLTGMTENISSYWKKASSFLGWDKKD
jgi:hypothetical protein